MKEIEADILVVGAGLVGLVAAHCFSLMKYNVVIVDKKDLFTSKTSQKDIRTVAVSEGSKQFLESLSLWGGLKKNAEPIKNINVFDRSSANRINFENSYKEKRLGYVIENKKFSNFLLTKLKKNKNTKIFFSSKLIKIDTHNNYSKTYFRNKIIKSKLIIAADGKNSNVREIVGNKVFKKNYSENALVVNFLHKKNLQNTAYEIFYNTGPLAILPMKSKNKFFQSSIIWSNKKSFVKKLIESNNSFIINIINEKVGKITGDVVKINSKQQFPLSAHINETFFNKKLVFVGDAAHSIHPIAGQGWNLGVKDVKNLHQVLKEFEEKKQNIGNLNFCRRYNALSYKNAFQLYQITDKLNFHFKRKNPIYRVLSNLGLKLVEKNPNIKNIIAKYAMGL